VGIAERYTRATRSSNLKCDAYHTDIDSIAAVGMSDKDFGSLLFRVKYAFEPHVYKRLVEEWRYYVTVKAVVHEWPSQINEKIVADEVMAYWLNDRCRPCGGKGHLELIPRVLDDEPCPHCRGTGKRELNCNRHIKRYVMDMLDMIERLVIRAGGEALQRLSDDMDL
jgi:hypothetical protein